jgi:hypothetical protein
MHARLAQASCKDCGVTDFAVLEFDHRDPATKVRDISSLAGGAGSWRAIEAEIAKCDVVCANCHRKRTAAHFNWRKLSGSFEVELPPLPRRGTPEYERIKSLRSGRARRSRNRAYVFNFLRATPVSCAEKLTLSCSTSITSKGSVGTLG